MATPTKHWEPKTVNLRLIFPSRDHQGEFESLGGRVMDQSRNLTTETFLHYALEDFQSINGEIA